MKKQIYKIVAISIVIVFFSIAGLVRAASAPQSTGSGAPSMVSYQGQVMLGGSPYSGTGYFKFAVVDSSGSTSYWSNDGSSTAGGEPTTSVALTVSSGLFNVYLGDTTLSGMTQALTAAAFDGVDRLLRVWFSSDNVAFTLLSPDQRIAAVPYALQAQNALNADTLDGLDGSAFQLRISDSCGVGSTIRLINSDGSVVCEAHDTLPGFSLVNGDTSSDATGYESSIAIGIDGLPVIAYRDTSHSSLKVLHCGDIACSTGNARTNVDTSSSVAVYQISLAIGADGLPVISYYDTTNQDLKIAHCGNVACSSGNTITSIDTSHEVGQYSALTIGVDGLPIISYQYHDSLPYSLKVLHCGNVDCTAGNVTWTVDPCSGSEGFGYRTAITIGADGLPVISYVNNMGDLKVAHCGDIQCVSGNTTTIVDNLSSINSTSISTGADGLPVIAYIESTSHILKVLHCGNSACTSANTINTVDSEAAYASITIGTDGLPIISYMDWTSKDLKVVHCGDVSCSSGNAIFTLDSTNQVGETTSITIGVDGFPIISYLDVTAFKLKVAHCSNTFCMPYWRRR